MKIVRVEGNLVVEIIPDEARPVSKWYNEDFAKQCVEAPDEVQPNWSYDPETGEFSDEYPEIPIPTDEPEEPVTTDDILNALLGVTDDE